jgi:hypothetical protein
MTDIDLSQLSRSYPFLWIARNFGVEYSSVLKVANGYDAGYLKPPEDDQGIFFLIFAACHAPWRWKFPKETSPVTVEHGLWEYGYNHDAVNAMLSEERWKDLG